MTDVLATDLEFPEGPAFHPDDESLWCTEGYGESLVRWDDGDVEKHHVGGIPNAMAFDAEGTIWICDFEAEAVRRYDPETRESWTVLETVDGERLDRPNDLAFDAEGNLVFTCSGDPEDAPNEPSQYVCCYDREDTVEKIAEGLVFPNGLTFVADGDALVVAETYEHRLVRGDWDPDTRTWSDVAPWAEVGGPVGPDGMVVSATEAVYVPVFGQGNVTIVEPDGTVSATHDLSGANPTNATFDPTGELGLVVTETERGELLSLPKLGPGSDYAPFLG